MVYYGAVESKAPPGYEILEELGKGGMGVVYRARQLSLDRIVALKVLVAPEGHEINEKALKRLRSEASIQADLSHENVVKLYDCDVSGPQPYLTLELVEGARTLHDLLVKGPPLLQDGLAKMERVASALACVHRQSIIHRDLKPQNILIDSHGRPLLTDFGVSLDLLSLATRCTAPLDLVGTPTYMSPEQLQSKPVDHRADIYAFGLILYEVVCGKLVFSGKASLVPFAARIADRIPPVTKFNASVPPRVIKILDRCLAFEPAERYPTADDLWGELTMLVETAPSNSGQAAAPPRPAAPPRVIQQKAPKNATAKIPPLQPPRVTRPGIATVTPPQASTSDTRFSRRAWWLAVVAAVVGVGFAALNGRVTIERSQTPAASASLGVPDPATAAERLVAAVQSLDHRDLGLPWLEKFAKRQRSTLAACGAGDEAAGREIAAAVRANLENLKLLAPLHTFLSDCSSYFGNSTIPEETRWRTRTALLDIEFIERFCVYHRVPWTAVGKGSLVEAVDALTGPLVDPATLDLRHARSWIRGPVATPDRYFPGESRLIHWQLPELPLDAQALLWFGTLRWPAGHLLDVTVNGKFRTLLRIPKPAAEVPPIAANVVEIIDAKGKRAIAEHLVEAGTTELGVRAFTGIWIPRAALSSKTEVLLRIVDLPGTRVEGMRNPALVERVISFVPASSARRP